MIDHFIRVATLGPVSLIWDTMEVAIPIPEATFKLHDATFSGKTKQYDYERTNIHGLPYVVQDTTKVLPLATGIKNVIAAVRANRVDELWNYGADEREYLTILFRQVDPTWDVPIYYTTSRPTPPHIHYKCTFG